MEVEIAVQMSFVGSRIVRPLVFPTSYIWGRMSTSQPPTIQPFHKVEVTSSGETAGCYLSGEAEGGDWCDCISAVSLPAQAGLNWLLLHLGRALPSQNS